MKISILCVGKIKEKYFTMGIEEYKKRLNRYCKLEIIEVPDEKTPDHASLVQEEQIKEKEGERLLKHIREDTYVIALALDGTELDSIALSKQIETMGINGISHITFLIGGSLGLAPSILNRANESWSFSKLTFPHQMMRMILLEQIYRGYRIMKGEPYHK